MPSRQGSLKYDSTMLRSFPGISPAWTPLEPQTHSSRHLPLTLEPKWWSLSALLPEILPWLPIAFETMPCPPTQPVHKVFSNPGPDPLDSLDHLLTHGPQTQHFFVSTLATLFPLPRAPFSPFTILLIVQDLLIHHPSELPGWAKCTSFGPNVDLLV